jgi:hypothetical protein
VLHFSNMHVWKAQTVKKVGPVILRYSHSEHVYLVKPYPREDWADHYWIKVIACERRLFIF